MAYQATIIPVMIASPGDVSKEREVIRQVIHDWNDINSASSQVMLAAVGWDTHISPELGARPQEIINKRVLKDCDLLIGVFWTRLGTPTGNSKSGSVEEIEEHIKLGKPAMLYFSSEPIAPESIDHEQFSAVTNFKEQCKKLGIIQQFDNTDDFKSKFAKQLQITLSSNDYLKELVNTEVITPSVSSQKKTPSLSNEALTLLKEAAKSREGHIIKMVVIGGMYISTGSERRGGSGRESAMWENALNELVKMGLVVERGNEGQLFELTHQGWAFADEIERN